MSAIPTAGATVIAIQLAAFAQHQSKPAITHGDGDWTYDELRARVFQTARALRGQGLRRGDMLALLTGNRPETFVLRYAANLLGCGTTVLYDGSAEEPLARMLLAAGATWLVFGAGDRADLVRAAAERAGCSMFGLGEASGAVNIAALARKEPPDELPCEAVPSDLAFIQLTGGSTGTPKGVPHDFRVPAFLSPRALAEWKDATQLLCTPVGHVGGALADMVLAAGGRVILHERFDAARVLETIERERVTFINLLPILLHALLDHPGLATADVSSLRGILLGGRPSTPNRVAKAVERFGPIISQGYGTFEAGRISVLSPADHLRPELLETVGRPVPGVEVQIRDVSGAVLGTGEVGEIWVRGPGVMKGYHRQPEETARVLKDGWYDTGDLGVFDGEGYLSVVGRTKDLIAGPQGKVYPLQVENVLLRHPGIQAAVVFGATGGDRDERVCAAVVPYADASMSEADVREWVREERGASDVPELVMFLGDLPTTGSEKPDVLALRRAAAESLS